MGGGRVSYRRSSWVGSTEAGIFKLAVNQGEEVG